jgi:Zn-finger protein
MKCELCKNKIPETFMKKILGTVVKDEKGKKHYVCKDCQSKHSNDKTTILKEL